MDSVSLDRSINGKRKVVDNPDAGSPHLRLSACSHEDNGQTGNFVDVLPRNADHKSITEKTEEEELLGCETPKSKGHLIPETTDCPPPPKKPRPARSSWRSKSATPTPSAGFFVVPRDFHLLFVPHRKAVRPAKRSSRTEFPRRSGDRRI